MVKEIVKWTHDRSSSVRSQTERVWNALGPADIPSIKALVQSKDPSDQAMGLRKLCDLGRTAVPALIDLLKDKDPDLQRTVVRILGQIGPPAREAVPSIAEILHDKDWQFRSVAAVALGQIGPDAKPAVAELTAALKDGERLRAGLRNRGPRPHRPGGTGRDNHPRRSPARRPCLPSDPPRPGRWGRSAPQRKRPCRRWKNSGEIRKITSARRPTRP